MNESEVYEPTGRQDVRDLLSKARHYNAELSKMDNASGAASPEQEPLDGHLRTAISALVCGLGIKDWDCVAQGICMLQDAEVRARVPQNRKCVT